MGGTCSVVGEVKGKGNELFKAGKFADAIEAYTSAIDADPKDHTIYSNRSAARMKLQQHGFAITDALTCVALAPTWPKGYYRLGSALAAVKKYGEAADSMRKALALSPDDASICSALADVEKEAGSTAVGRGYAYIWGSFEGGRGAGSSTTPKMLEGAKGRQVVDVACGLQHTVLVTASGEVLAWGSNKYSQCGTVARQEVVSLPTYVSGLFGHRCATVACGGAHTLVVSDMGKTFSWGQNACGQLGLGHKTALVATPTQVQALADRQVGGVACGFGHTVIVLVGGECLTCGWNASGQCGNGSKEDVSSPQAVSKLKGQQVAHAAAGGGHTAVVMAAGELMTFGAGSCGQLGLGSTGDSLVPARVEGVLRGVCVAAVACGEEFTVAISAERCVYAFGLNNVGQLGGSCNSHTRDTPVELTGLRERRIDACSCTQAQSLALTGEGGVVAWGSGHADESGGSGLTPQQIQALIRGEDPMRWVERIECGRRHFCVVVRGTHARACVASGRGLSESLAGRKEKIQIKAFSESGDPMTQGGDVFDVMLFSDDGEVMADVQTDDCLDGTYDCHYTSSKAGACRLWVRLGGAHIRGSPFTILVAPQVPSASHSRLSAHCSLAHLYHEAGKALAVLVLVRDVYDNTCAVPLADLQVRVTRTRDEGGAAEAIDHALELDSKTSTPRIVFLPTLSGEYSVRVVLKGRGPIGSGGGGGEEEALEVVVVSAAADARRSTASGPGLERAVVGELSELHVRLEDQYGNAAQMFRNGYNQEFAEAADVPLSVSLHEMLTGGGRGAAVEVSTVACGFFYGAGHRASTFSVGYTVLKTLPLLLQVSVGGKDLFAAPLKIPVDAGPTNALYSLVSGDGIQGGSLRGAMLSKTLTIESRDEYDNRKTAGGDVFEVALALEGGGSVPVDVKDNNNGTYVCAYTVTTPGVHTLTVALRTAAGQAEVCGSPYAVRVSADPAEEVRRRHQEQAQEIDRQKAAADRRRAAHAAARAALAAAGRERENASAEAQASEAAERKRKEALAAERREGETKAKEEEKVRRLMERLRREEEARRRAVEQEEDKRLAVLEKIKCLDEKRRRPESATKRAGGGFILSFTGDGGIRRTAWQ